VLLQLRSGGRCRIGFASHVALCFEGVLWPAVMSMRSFVTWVSGGACSRFLLLRCSYSYGLTACLEMHHIVSKIECVSMSRSPAAGAFGRKFGSKIDGGGPVQLRVQVHGEGSTVRFTAQSARNARGMKLRRLLKTPFSAPIRHPCPPFGSYSEMQSNAWKRLTP